MEPGFFHAGSRFLLCFVRFRLYLKQHTSTVQYVQSTSVQGYCSTMHMHTVPEPGTTAQVGVHGVQVQCTQYSIRKDVMTVGNSNLKWHCMLALVFHVSK